jgi:biopolymer transport protein ExbB/TolQ
MTTTPARPNRRLITAGLVIGSLLTLSPLFGMLGTVVGMMNSFNALGSGGATGSTGELSRGIGQALASTAAGLIFFLPGLAILILSIIHLRRAKMAALSVQAPPPGEG